MKCKTIHKKLIFLLEGDLPENESVQIRNHLSECHHCKAFADELSKTLGIIENEKNPELNPFFFTRIKAKIELQAEVKNLSLNRTVFTKILQPAIFSILLIVGIYSGIKIGEPVTSNSFYSENTEIEIIPYLNEMQSEPIEEFLME